MTSAARAPLDVGALSAALGARWPRVEVVASTESTNADLLADTAAPHRSLLAAEVQTAGRGRLDRRWVSPAGAGLTFSVLLRPQPPPATWGWLPLLAGVALHEAVGEVSGVRTALKWPNDLLTDDADTDTGTVIGSGAQVKLAGILAQTSAGAVVLGIGVNVSTTRDELPVATAGSLALAGAGDVDRTRLCAVIAQRLDARVARWSDADGDAGVCGLAAAYTGACATIGREVRVSTTAGQVSVGTAIGIDADGRLLIDTGAGVQAVGAGDVEHVRPTG